jgi:hypothetical protein
MNDAKLLEAVRMLQDATKLLDAILVEQIGGCTVVSNEPQMPEEWKVRTIKEAVEWGKWKSGTDYKEKDTRHLASHIGHDGFGWEGCFNGAEITREQFIEWVYNPWKASLNQPDYDVSNVYPTFQIGDKVEVNGVGLRGTVTGLYGTDEYFVKMPHDTFIYSGRVIVKVA